MAKFRKKPVVVEAMRWEADHAALKVFVGESPDRHFLYNVDTNELTIVTLEGEMAAPVGYWIIRGVQGELYPCKPDIFDATYEAVED